MQSLIIRNGLIKKADGEDGPSFEQQFGILANAQVVDKFKQLDTMKLAFQLIDKEDDNSNACGATVYMVGKTVIFVPAFFKNGKIKTGDMMFIAQSQQFLPLTDPWLAWLKTKDLNDAGQTVEPELLDNMLSSKGTTIRNLADPIVKTAAKELIPSKNIQNMYFWLKPCGLEKSASQAEAIMSSAESRFSTGYMRGLLKLNPDLTKTETDMNVLDQSIRMGKTATERMLDKLIKSPDFLNATLTFYGPESVVAFTKKASELDTEKSNISLILPFDEESKTLTAQEQKALYKDGFFIKRAADEGPAPSVTRYKQVSNLFSVLDGSCKAQLLQMDGSVKDVTVLSMSDTDKCRVHCGSVATSDSYATGRLPTKVSCEDPERAFLALFSDGDTGTYLPLGTMCIASSKQELKPEDVSKLGREWKDSDSDNNRDDDYWEVVVTPDGHCFEKTMLIGYNKVVSVADKDRDLKVPMITRNSVILPAGCRIVRVARTGKDSEKVPTEFVTMGSLDPFITEYCNKKYHKLSIYHNGSDYVVSGDKSEKTAMSVSLKEAAYHLVKDYGIEPGMAKVMLKDASNGTSFNRPRSTMYLVEKRASDGDWEESNIGMSTHVNQPPQVSNTEMPAYLQDPNMLAQAVQTAAESGIKEVFDITALKLIARKDRFFDEIQDDLPMFMQVLDSLCRKLFQFYWHTDRMEEKYGLVKMKALEDSLKTTIDSLSEITVFFKMRTVDGSGTTRDSAGDLMTGSML